MTLEDGNYIENSQVLYNEEFYRVNLSGMDTSARILASAILETIGRDRIRSIVDVGCGAGALLFAFQELGVQKILGIDGSWAKSKYQLLRGDQFLSTDLRNPKVNMSSKFDLVVSTEVAEHIESEFAANFIDFLVSLGDLIVFSSAIPGQGGTHHVNEQWQSYWEKLFADRGYNPLDIIRPKLWNNGLVHTHYKQNLLIYIKNGSDDYKEIQASYGGYSNYRILNMVHPETFAYYNNPKHYGIKKSVLGLVSGLANFVGRPFRK